MNEKKCNGYESMFIFLNEEDFKKHLETCEECRKEHEKMQRISDLIQEAKPYIKSEKRKLYKFKAACLACAFIFTGLSYPLYTIGSNVYSSYNQEHNLTADEMELPVDEYGFLYIN